MVLLQLAAYICWIVISKFINEKLDEVEDKWIGFWRNSVWVTSAWLWWVWLSHDVANIAVYLPRQIDVNLLLIVLAYFTALTFLYLLHSWRNYSKSCFRENWNKICKISNNN